MHTAQQLPTRTHRTRQGLLSRVAGRLTRVLVAVAVIVGVALTMSGPASADQGGQGVDGNRLADVVELRVLDPEVAAASETNRDETIALATPSSLISLIGAVVLAGGVVLAVVGVESSGRDEAEGELMGRA